MADLNLTVTSARVGGVNITDNDTTVSAANTYFFPNDGRVKLLVTSAAGCNVTVESTATVDGNAVTDPVIAVPAGKQLAIGPFVPAVYNDSQERVKVTFSAAADVYALRG